MRPSLTMPVSPRGRAGLGALILVVPGTFAALAQGAGADPAVAAAGAPSLGSLQVAFDRTHVPFAGRVTATGHAPASARGRTLLLEHAAAGSAAWRALAATRIHTDGSFRLRAALTRSGSLRVVPAAAAAPAADGRLQFPTTLAPSAPARVLVGSVLRLAPGSLSAGRRVSGQLLPRIAGRQVRLERGTRGGWRTVATTRTGPDGRFHVRGPRRDGSFRVAFAGDRLSGASASRPSTVRVLHFADDLASWYDDAGATGCGFHAGMGVANRDLPCGTKVTIRYGGRQVDAVVDDRGPYVGGRNWDLNQDVAGALGFDGVGDIKVAIR